MANIEKHASFGRNCYIAIPVKTAQYCATTKSAGSFQSSTLNMFCRFPILATVWHAMKIREIARITITILFLPNVTCIMHERFCTVALGHKSNQAYLDFTVSYTHRKFLSFPCQCHSMLFKVRMNIPRCRYLFSQQGRIIALQTPYCTKHSIAADDQFLACCSVD